MTSYVDDNKFPKVIVTEGSAPASPAAGNQSLFIDSANHHLKRVNSSGTVVDIESGGGGGTAGTSILLDYALGTDITALSMSSSTWTDVIANQSFTVASATSIVEVSVRGMADVFPAANTRVFVRIAVDSGGTPINKILGGESALNATGANPFSGSCPLFISGLSAASHTVKIQAFSEGQTASLYCTAASNNEFLTIQVVEHKN